MKIYDIKQRTPLFIEQLTDVWESSVRATHDFLSDEEVSCIREYVPQALKSVEYLVTAERTPGVPIAFMGVENGRLEMLFLAPDERGAGLGERLLRHGIKNYGVNELTVNEQNPQAVGFYEYEGFKIYKRTECDEEGRAYPLLYMKLA